MSDFIARNDLRVDPVLVDFIEKAALPGTGVWAAYMMRFTAPMRWAVCQAVVAMTRRAVHRSFHGAVLIWMRSCLWQMALGLTLPGSMSAMAHCRPHCRTQASLSGTMMGPTAWLKSSSK